MRASSLEREYRRICKTIDHMIAAQYTELNTMGFALVMISSLVVMVTLPIVFDNSLPEVVSENDSARMEFVGRRAFEWLKQLTDIGPRPVGSNGNKLAVDYLQNEIYNIKQLAPTRWNEIFVDVQTSSGSLTMVNEEKNFRRETYYKNIRNIVVKLSSNSTCESILINCHFDSVFNSPGTSDDGLNCAVMLEILRVLSRTEYPLNRNVIFLFNGAAEDGVSGSHAFITKHKWAMEVVTFLNLDAKGAGGRQMLLHSAPEAYVLSKIYSQSVPYPSARVINEELFRSASLDTDFSIFLDYGHLQGLNLAHLKNGYVYHTAGDNITAVSENIIQLAGDNTLALLRSLIDYDNLPMAIYESNEKSVYFDVFGKMVVRYPLTIAYLVNLIVICVSLHSAMDMLYVIFRGKPAKIILHHVLIDLAFVVIGLVAVTLVLYLLAGLLKINDIGMVWYSNRWFAASYYAVAAVLVMFTAVKMRQTFIYTLLNGEQETKVFIFVIQIIITIILSFGTLSGIRSSFVLCMGLIGVSISHYIMMKTQLRLQIVEHKFITYTVINFLPAAYCVYTFVPCIEIAIPMMGRTSSDFDSEIVVCLMTGIAVLITLAYFIPLVVMVKDFWIMQYIFVALYVVQLFYMLSSTLSPFSDQTPQRFVALHVNRKLASSWNNTKYESSGYLVTPNDMIGAENILKLFEEERFQPLGNVGNTCSQELFCGVPSFYANRITAVHLSLWTEREQPIVDRKQILYCVEGGNLTKTYFLKMKGSTFMDVVILPLNNAKLLEWSFDSAPSDELQWNGHPTYFTRFHDGSFNTTWWSFWLKFDISELNSADDYVLKLGWSVYYSSNNSYTSQFRKFLDTFPSWMNVISMVVDYEEYLIPEKN